ncbi:MAG: ATP-grasp domain-containing protein, partial [Gammaproteobacteria bacterium]
ASVGLVMTDAKVIEACMNKVLACQKAQDCNVPQMPYEIVGDRHELDNAVRGIGYPCVVKPVSERFTIGGEKASILRSQDDLDGNFELWPADNARLIVQGFAEGQRHNCHFLADEGRLLAYFEQVVLRTTRANGTGYGTDGLSVPPSPQLRKYCEALLMNLNYSGAGCVQFMVDDRQGTACFLEINPRLDATCALAVRCGYDFPLMALEYARYRRGITFAPPGNDSVYSRCRVVWLLGEIEALGHELRRHHIGARQAWTAFWGTVRSALTADVHLVWSWRDPLPALHAFTRLLAAVVVHRKASD